MLTFISSPRTSAYMIALLFERSNFVSLEEIKEKTGFAFEEVILLKPHIEEILSSESDKISLTMQYYLSTPGIFLES